MRDVCEHVGRMGWGGMGVRRLFHWWLCRMTSWEVGAGGAGCSRVRVSMFGVRRRGWGVGGAVVGAVQRGHAPVHVVPPQPLLRLRCEEHN
jgi:hypothetical protein